MKEGLARLENTPDLHPLLKNHIPEYKKALNTPIDLKDVKNTTSFRKSITDDQGLLKRSGRTIIDIDRNRDMSTIGKRGAAQKAGKLEMHNKFNNEFSKFGLRNEKELTKVKKLNGIKLDPLEKGDYVKRAGRSLANKELKAENAIKAESKFATKKAGILAKRAKVANLKKAGKIGLGVGVAAGLGYGGYKAYQHFKNKDKKD
jgi:hypothetical protein